MFDDITLPLPFEIDFKRIEEFLLFMQKSDMKKAMLLINVNPQTGLNYDDDSDPEEEEAKAEFEKLVTDFINRCAVKLGMNINVFVALLDYKNYNTNTVKFEVCVMNHSPKDTLVKQIKTLEERVDLLWHAPGAPGYDTAKK